MFETNAAQELSSRKLNLHIEYNKTMKKGNKIHTAQDLELAAFDRHKWNIVYRNFFVV